MTIDVQDHSTEFTLISRDGMKYSATCHHQRKRYGGKMYPATVSWDSYGSVSPADASLMMMVLKAATSKAVNPVEA